MNGIYVIIIVILIIIILILNIVFLYIPIYRAERGIQQISGNAGNFIATTNAIITSPSLSSYTSCIQNSASISDASEKLEAQKNCEKILIQSLVSDLGPRAEKFISCVNTQGCSIIDCISDSPCGTSSTDVLGENMGIDTEFLYQDEWVDGSQKKKYCY